MDERRFGPYRLEGLIGRGGMGVVYRAVDTRKNRTVALKLLPAEFATGQEFRARFRLEAEAAGRLSDPHVIPIHDYGEIDGQFFIDMRLVDGVDLATLVDRDGPLPVRRAVAIVSQVAGALDSAHRAELVHRDVKPTNVLISDGAGEDFVYLIDFGVVRAASDAKLTVTGRAVGTLGYMAPERFLGIGGEDPRVDIYALGCVLYEILTGQPPFGTGGLPTLMYAHLNLAPPRPSSTRDDIRPAFDDVVARAMAKDPDERYATAGRLAAAVQEAAAQGTPPARGAAPGPARPASGPSTVGQPGLSPAPDPSGTGAARPAPSPAVDASVAPAAPPAARRAATFRTSGLVAVSLTVWFVVLGLVVPPMGLAVPGLVISLGDVVGGLLFGVLRYALARDEPRSAAVYTGAAGGLTVHHLLSIGVGQGDYAAGSVPVALVALGLVWMAVDRLTGTGPVRRARARRGAILLTGAGAVVVPVLALMRTATTAAGFPATAYVADQIATVAVCGVPLLAVVLALRLARGDDRVAGATLAATAVALGLHLTWRVVFAAVAWGARQYQDMPSRILFVVGSSIGLVLFLVYLVLLVRDFRNASARS